MAKTTDNPIIAKVLISSSEPRRVRKEGKKERTVQEGTILSVDRASCDDAGVDYDDVVGKVEQKVGRLWMNTEHEDVWLQRPGSIVEMKISIFGDNGALQLDVLSSPIESFSQFKKK